MKWRDLTPEQLRYLARDLNDTAHDGEIDRKQLTEENSFDVVAAERCVARRLEREAKRRERASPLERRAARVAKQNAEVARDRGEG